jgi:hypothetical protein
MRDHFCSFAMSVKKATIGALFQADVERFCAHLEVCVSCGGMAVAWRWPCYSRRVLCNSRAVRSLQARPSMFGNATALSIDAGENANANPLSVTATFQVRHPRVLGPSRAWPSRPPTCCWRRVFARCAGLPVHARVPGDDHGCYASVSDYIDELRERCGATVGGPHGCGASR